MTCTALYEGNHILHKSQKYKKINYKIVQFVQKKIILEYERYLGIVVLNLYIPLLDSYSTHVEIVSSYEFIEMGTRLRFLINIAIQVPIKNKH